MLRILKSSLAAVGRLTIAEDIAKRAVDRHKMILIVPEQQTVMAESETFRMLPPDAPLYFEATNFTRLANTTFRTLGGLSGEYCDKSKKALIMWRALTELSPLLTLTRGRREISSGLVEQAMAAVGDMQSKGISSEELSALLSSDAIREDKRLEGKVADLAAIYSLYKRLLGERYADTGEDALVMLEKLRETPDFLTDTEIFIEGFTSFTEPQYKLIALLAARTSVTVHLPLPKGREEHFEYTEIAHAMEKLKTAARRANADIKVEAIDGRRATASEALSMIGDELWRKTPVIDKISLQNPDELRIFEAQTPFEECDFLCADIARRVIGGASYRDFAVVARHADGYNGILDTAFKKAGIPAFLSYGNDTASFEAIKLIYTAYSIVISGFMREDVLTYAKCGLSGISREECDEFEVYVNKWQINGKRFTDDTVWNMNPLGYTARRPDGTDDLLARIHRTRIRLISPLSDFVARASAARTVREHARVLVEFLVKIGLEASLDARADKLDALGESEFAEDNRRLWDVICRALDTLVEVGEDTDTDTEGFLAQLKTVFASTDLGRIPSFVDEVTVGSADMLRLYGKKHVYLLGVNAGEFPAAVSDSTYFSDRDKATLSGLGLAIEPELEIKNAREMFIFSRVFSYASESVTLLYTCCNTQFKAIEKASVIDRIGKLTGGTVAPISISSLPVGERIWTPEAALRITRESEPIEYDGIREALIASGYRDKLTISEGDITNGRSHLGQDVCSELYGDRMSMSSTRLDSYVGCPFGYFCKYTLSLSEESRAEFDASSIGTFIHSILESFFRGLEERGEAPDSLSHEERVKLTEDAAKKYIASLGENVTESSALTRIKIKRLCRAAMPVVDGLCEEFSQSKFKPRFFELAIRRGADTPSPVRVTAPDGTEVTVYGFIDRVDTYKSGNNVYVRVVDYKTGQKDFSPDDMEKGENLQMFLYLESILKSENRAFLDRIGVCEGDRLVPAGVIYVKTSVSDVRVDKPDDAIAERAVMAAQEREGMVIDDAEAIAAMGLPYTPLYSARTPDKIPDSRRKYMYDEQGFENIMETVEGCVGTVAQRIRKGDVSPMPKDTGSGASYCTYCKFKPICRKAIIK